MFIHSSIIRRRVSISPFVFPDVAIFHKLKFKTRMNISIRNHSSLINIILFGMILIGLVSNSKWAYLLVLVGVLLNLFFYLRIFHSKSGFNGSMKASTKEPDWSEKNLIMEDLDKEAARRRKEEELSRN